MFPRSYLIKAISMINQKIYESPNGSFQMTQLSKSVAICEALKGDRYHWDNEEGDLPAFITYIGFSYHLEAYKFTDVLMKFYRAAKCVVRKGKRLNYPFEIKVYGLQRETDCSRFGLDDLVLSRSAREEYEEAQMRLEQYQEYRDRFLATADYYDSAWAD